MNEGKGFTLVELLVVIIIIGILSTLATTQYGGIKERALNNEAKANLKLISAAEKIYRMETGIYYPQSGSGETNVANISSSLKLSLSETNWDYNITGGNTTFNATADRKITGGCQYYITYNDTDGEPDSVSCP